MISGAGYQTLENVKAFIGKKNIQHTRLDGRATKRVYGMQTKILDYKESVVQCLRDIKLEKTLVDRIIETVGDYVRQMHNCRRDLSAYILSLGKSQDEIFGVFQQLDERSINPVAAADQLGMTIEELFSFKEMVNGKIEILNKLEENTMHDVDQLEKSCGGSARETTTPWTPSRS